MATCVPDKIYVLSLQRKKYLLTIYGYDYECKESFIGNSICCNDGIRL